MAAKRQIEDFDESAPSPKRPHESPAGQHAFKVLCTDDLAAAIQGSQESIQRDTGTIIVFSNADDYFPDTHYRTLGVFGDHPASIFDAAGQILQKIIELGEEERKHSGPQEYTGAAGEYLFRFCVADKTSRALIGPAGTNIKRLRNSSGAKIYVENESYLGNQMVRTIGTPDAVLDCLRQVNQVVQQGAGTEDFQVWAETLNFSEPDAEGAPEGPGAEASPAAAAAAELVDERTDRLADAVGRLPPGSALLRYSVSCELPAGQADALSKYIAEVEEATGATVEIEPGADGDESLPCIMSVVGPLLSIYAAHITMMKRSKLLEQSELHGQKQQKAQEQRRQQQKQKRRQQEQSARKKRWQQPQKRQRQQQQQQQSKDKGPPSKEALKAQIDMLQSQLNSVQAQLSGSSGGGGGNNRAKTKGKGPGKGKGKGPGQGKW